VINFFSADQSYQVETGFRENAGTSVCELHRSGHLHRLAGTGGWVAGVVAALMVLGGCGAASAGGSQAGAIPQEATSNWTNPIGGVNEISMMTAQTQVPFKLNVILGLPRPFRILLTPGRPRDLRVAVLQYKTQRGLVDEYEETPQLSLRQFQAVIKYWVGLNGKPGTQGSTTAVKLTDGSPALITTSADGGTSDIRWIEAGVEYKIRGPSLSKKDCITLANDVQR
jgi:hypothetical protein